jgi:orotate phosphoribosyltransferase-like protein
LIQRARNLDRMGLSLEQIAEGTSLSLENVKSILKEQKEET